MSGYLLDTNVVSETMRRVPDLQVVTFLAEHDDLWLSTIVLHELDYGVRLLEQGQRRNRLQADLAGFATEYEDRILPLDRAAAEWAAQFRAQSQHSGRTLELGDALMAGIAKANGLCVATRNVTDFHHIDIDVTNPWVAS